MLISLLAFKFYQGGLLRGIERWISSWLLVILIGVVLFLHAALGPLLWGRSIQELSDRFWLLPMLFLPLSLLRLLSSNLVSELSPMLLIIFHKALILG